nr:hypothetical protein [Tanacetum cinerariifolium]
MFSTIKLVSRHQNTQQFGALLPIELTNEDIRNSNAYKEYYAVATGATPPMPKAGVWKTRSNEGTGSIPGVPNVPTDESEEELSWNSTDEEGDDNDDDQEVERIMKRMMKRKESFDPILKTPKDTDDEDNGEEDLGLNVGREEGHDEEEEEEEEEYELYRDVNINQGRGIQMTQEVEDSHVTLTPVNPDGQQQSSLMSSQFVTSMLNPTLDAGMESIFETTSRMDVQTPTSVAPLPMSVPTITPSTIATVTTIKHAPTLPTTAPSTLLQDLPNFGLLFGFDNRLKTLEANFSEFMQTNQFVGAVSAIPRIVHRYMDQQMNEAVLVAIQLRSEKLREEAQKENDEFLKTIDENMQKMIKEQVKEQVKTSYDVAADLSEMELKKILIKKMEGNKSIHRSNEQRNLYKALVEAYKSDKIILDTYRDTVTLKRRRDDDADKDEEPFAGSDRGSKRRRERKEHESASAPTETATRSTGRSTQGSKSRQMSASNSAIAKEPMQPTFEMEEPVHPGFEIGADDQPIVESSQHPEWFSQQQKPPTTDRDWNKTLSATHGSIQLWISELAKQSDTRSSLNELIDTLLDFSNFLINRLKVDTLTLEFIAGPTYELLKGSCKSLVVLKYHLEDVSKATTDQLDWVNPEGASSRKYTTSVTKTKATDYGHIKWIEDLVPRTMWIEEPIGIVIQRSMEDLQLGVESYQKKLNLTKPDTYRSDLKRKEAYIAYSNLRGFIYHNKDKKNRLMRIDELHKFNDGTLIDVRNALDDRLKGIRMKYLPHLI